VRDGTASELGRLYGQARFVVDRHYALPLTAAAVARALASSPRQLHRAYERSGEGTFREQLVRRRMLAAAELLAQPAIPVADVARLVGYRQPSHFARAFARRFGCSPAAFRRGLRAARPREDARQGDRAPARAMLRGDAPRARTPPRGSALGGERRRGARALQR
jgi:AraC-like DNA-binding protein